MMKLNYKLNDINYGKLDTVLYLISIILIPRPNQFRNLIILSNFIRKE